MVRSNTLFALVLAAVPATLAVAQGAGPSQRDPGGAPEATVVVPVKLSVEPPAAAKTNDATTGGEGPSDFDYDLRVVSMRGPITQTTTAGASQQVVIVTVGNYGRAATTAPATLFIDQEIQGRPFASNKVVLPSLTPGSRAILTIPVKIPQDLRAQVCLTTRLDF